MSDFTIFPGLNRAWNIGAPAAIDPATAWKNYFFECPVAVAAHLQRFAMRQAQEQMQLIGEVARDPNPATAISRQAAYLQQSALAWNTELTEIAELVQGKLLNKAPAADGQSAPAPFSKAA